MASMESYKNFSQDLPDVRVLHIWKEHGSKLSHSKVFMFFLDANDNVLQYHPQPSHPIIYHHSVTS
jgi:hypothetical protein